MKCEDVVDLEVVGGGWGMGLVVGEKKIFGGCVGVQNNL